jgi:hypothetical protein
MQCVDFRPSEIAAAVAAVVAGEERDVDIDEACTRRVHKVREPLTHTTLSQTSSSVQSMRRSVLCTCNVTCVRMLQQHLSRHHDTHPYNTAEMREPHLYPRKLTNRHKQSLAW